MEFLIRTVFLYGVSIIGVLLITNSYIKRQYRKERMEWMKHRIESSNLSNTPKTLNKTKESEWDINPPMR